MNNPASLHGIALARGNGRSMCAHGPLLAAVLGLALAGCATGPEACITRSEIQRVPKPVFIDIPEEFIEPLAVQPIPADLTNRDLEVDVRGLEDVLDKAQTDRAELRRIQRERKQREGDQ